MGGGFSDKASKGRVRIIRKTNGKEEVLEKVKMDEPVLNNDVIVVPESFFLVYGRKRDSFTGLPESCL
jgi:polysaccharide export outer membrane protein